VNERFLEEFLRAERPKPSNPLELSVVGWLLERKLREFAEHYPRREDEVWVTDLVRCWLKREMVLRHRALALANLPTPSRFMVGDLIHDAVERVVERIAEEAGWKATREYEAERTVVVGGREYAVKGRIDVLVEGNGRRYVVEVKDVRDIKLPFEHHDEQLKAYLWLVDADGGKIIYISKAGMIEREIHDPWTEEDVVRAIEERRAPRFDWECSFCTYTSWCPRYMERKT